MHLVPSPTTTWQTLAAISLYVPQNITMTHCICGLSIIIQHMPQFPVLVTCVQCVARWFAFFMYIFVH